MKAVTVRILHRYVGFFLAGIMLVYGLSGVVLVYRNTDVFKVASHVEKKVATNLSSTDLGRALRIKNFKVNREEGNAIHFKMGTYNKVTGEVNYTKMDHPYLLGKLIHLHKANTNSPVYWLNIFFGLTLVFFAISTFWMFKPKSKTFKTGVKYSAAGVVFTLVLLFI